MDINPAMYGFNSSSTQYSGANLPTFGAVQSMAANMETALLPGIGGGGSLPGLGGSVDIYDTIGKQAMGLLGGGQEAVEMVSAGMAGSAALSSAASSQSAADAGSATAASSSSDTSSAGATGSASGTSAANTSTPAATTDPNANPANMTDALLKESGFVYQTNPYSVQTDYFAGSASGTTQAASTSASASTPPVPYGLSTSGSNLGQVFNSLL